MALDPLFFCLLSIRSTPPLKASPSVSARMAEPSPEKEAFRAVVPLLGEAALLEEPELLLEELPLPELELFRPELLLEPESFRLELLLELESFRLELLLELESFRLELLLELELFRLEWLLELELFRLELFLLWDWVVLFLEEEFLLLLPVQDARDRAMTPARQTAKPRVRYSFRSNIKKHSFLILDFFKGLSAFVEAIIPRKAEWFLKPFLNKSKFFIPPQI